MHGPLTLISKDRRKIEANTANFYQFKSASRLTAKSQLEKVSPQRTKEKEQCCLLVFSKHFLIYSKTMQLHCQSSQIVPGGAHPHSAHASLEHQAEQG